MIMDQLPHLSNSQVYYLKNSENNDNEIERKLDIQEDIYSLTYLNFINNHDPLWHNQLMLKCFFTSFLQLSLGFLVVRESGEFKYDKQKESNHYQGLGQVITGGIALNATRFICTLLLHMMIMPEIRSGMSMLEFAVYNQFNEKHKFKSNHKELYPIWIATMKITGGILTELLNMWMMGFNSTEEDVVKDFIAFGIISSIDDIMVAVIKSLDVEQAVEGQTFNYKTVKFLEFK